MRLQFQLRIEVFSFEAYEVAKCTKSRLWFNIFPRTSIDGSCRPSLVLKAERSSSFAASTWPCICKEQGVVQVRHRGSMEALYQLHRFATCEIGLLNSTTTTYAGSRRWSDCLVWSSFSLTRDLISPLSPSRTPTSTGSLSKEPSPGLLRSEPEAQYPSPFSTVRSQSYQSRRRLEGPQSRRRRVPSRPQGHRGIVAPA